MSLFVDWFCSADETQLDYDFINSQASLELQIEAMKIKKEREENRGRCVSSGCNYSLRDKWSSIAKYGTNDDNIFEENLQFLERVREDIKDKRIHFNDTYCLEDYRSAEIYNSYENGSYYGVEIRISACDNVRCYYQLLDNEGHTIIKASDSIEYLGHNCFLRKFNDKTSLIKNKDVYIEEDMIREISPISDDGCALMFDKLGYISVLDINNYDPQLNTIAFSHPLNVKGIHFSTRNNQFVININHCESVIDSSGKKIYTCKDNECIITKDDGYYLKIRGGEIIGKINNEDNNKPKLKNRKRRS